MDWLACRLADRAASCLIARLLNLTLVAFYDNALTREACMRSFIVACIAAIVIAAFGTVTLDLIQEPVSVAFATSSVRV